MKKNPLRSGTEYQELEQSSIAFTENCEELRENGREPVPETYFAGSLADTDMIVTFLEAGAFGDLLQEDQKRILAAVQEAVQSNLREIRE